MIFFAAMLNAPVKAAALALLQGISCSLTILKTILTSARGNRICPNCTNMSRSRRRHMLFTQRSRCSSHFWFRRHFLSDRSTSYHARMGRSRSRKPNGRSEHVRAISECCWHECHHQPTHCDRPHTTKCARRTAGIARRLGYLQWNYDRQCAMCRLWLP